LEQQAVERKEAKMPLKSSKSNLTGGAVALPEPTRELLTELETQVRRLEHCENSMEVVISVARYAAVKAGEIEGRYKVAIKEAYDMHKGRIAKMKSEVDPWKKLAETAKNKVYELDESQRPEQKAIVAKPANPVIANIQLDVLAKHAVETGQFDLLMPNMEKIVEIRKRYGKECSLPGVIFEEAV
jgi:hypothetical protein